MSRSLEAVRLGVTIIVLKVSIIMIITIIMIIVMMMIIIK